jgi:hypothetical protein
MAKLLTKRKKELVFYMENSISIHYKDEIVIPLRFTERYEQVVFDKHEVRQLVKQLNEYLDSLDNPK